MHPISLRFTPLRTIARNYARKAYRKTVRWKHLFRPKEYLLSAVFKALRRQSGDVGHVGRRTCAVGYASTSTGWEAPARLGLGVRLAAGRGDCADCGGGPCPRGSDPFMETANQQGFQVSLEGLAASGSSRTFPEAFAAIWLVVRAIGPDRQAVKELVWPLWVAVLNALVVTYRTRSPARRTAQSSVSLQPNS